MTNSKPVYEFKKQPDSYVCVIKADSFDGPKMGPEKTEVQARYVTQMLRNAGMDATFKNVKGGHEVVVLADQGDLNVESAIQGAGFTLLLGAPSSKKTYSATGSAAELVANSAAGQLSR